MTFFLPLAHFFHRFLRACGAEWMCAHQSEQRQPPRMKRCFFATDETPFLHEIFRKKLTDFLSPNWFSSWSQHNRYDTILLEPHARDLHLWMRPTDLSWHYTILVTVREALVKNFRAKSPTKSRSRECKQYTSHVTFFSCLRACVIICHTTLAQVFVRVISSMSHAPECLISLRPSLRTLHLSLPSSTSSS